VFTLLGAASAILVISGLVSSLGRATTSTSACPQVLPRRFGIYPLTAGVILLIVAGVGLLFP
jgi:hypothetical protein